MEPNHRVGPLSDLDSEEEVAELVRQFYGAVAQDDLLGPIFNDVAQVDWAAHLPKLTLFWCRVLFGTVGYSGNPYAEHARIHGLSPLRPAHFIRWLELFNETLDGSWEGPNVEKVKHLAKTVARVHSSELIGVKVELQPEVASIP
jgi:hemoglobin